MTTVRCGENESVESALKRFKRKCQKDGIIGDLKKKQEYAFAADKSTRTALFFRRKDDGFYHRALSGE